MKVQRAFASYANADRESVMEARQLLRSTGMELFVDCIEIRGGEEWERRLESEIKAASCFYLFWSSNAATSEWVKWALDNALRHNENGADPRLIVPVVLDGTPVPPRIARYQVVKLSTLVEGMAAGFSTERILPTDHGFEIQLSISNPNKSGSINLFDLRAAVIDARAAILYAPGTAHRLAPVTLAALRKLRTDPKVRLLQSQSGLFLGTRLFENDFFLLAPGEIDTFKTELVVDPTEQITWSLGFLLQYSDAFGRRRVRVSDRAFVVVGGLGTISILALDLDSLCQRLARIDDYDWEEDVVAKKRLDGVYELTAATAPDPRWFLDDCLRFLKLQKTDVDTMEVL